MPWEERDAYLSPGGVMSNMATAAPAWARAVANENPRPLFPPVTRATRPLRENCCWVGKDGTEKNRIIGDISLLTASIPCVSNRLNYTR